LLTLKAKSKSPRVRKLPRTSCDRGKWFLTKTIEDFVHTVYVQDDLTVVDLARNLGLSLETHLVHTEDGYVLQVYSNEASLRYRIIRNKPHQKPRVES
jgi:hypothetical protein